jgi:hypothetical protein
MGNLSILKFTKLKPNWKPCQEDVDVQFIFFPQNNLPKRRSNWQLVCHKSFQFGEINSLSCLSRPFKGDLLELIFLFVLFLINRGCLAL